MLSRTGTENPAAHASGYYQGLTEKYYIKINTVGKCIDVELYRKQITLPLPFKHALMYFMNQTADIVYKFNLSGGFEILPDLVT